MVPLLKTGTFIHCCIFFVLNTLSFDPCTFWCLTFTVLHSFSETSSFISRNRCRFDQLSCTGDAFWPMKPKSKKKESGVDSVSARTRLLLESCNGIKGGPRKNEKVANLTLSFYETAGLTVA